MNFTKILTFAIIAMFLLVPFASAKQEVADSAKQDKKIDEKVTDKTKESAKEISNKDTDIKGKVTVTDSDSSKYTAKKTKDSEIRIKKDETGDAHTKSTITVSKSDLEAIDIDGDGKFGCMRVSDSGEVLGYRVLTTSQLTSGVEMIFSENIINGFSGSNSVTQSVNISNATIPISAVNASVVTIEIPDVGTYSAFNQSNASTYLYSPSAAYNFNGNLNPMVGSITGSWVGSAKYVNSSYANFSSSVNYVSLSGSSGVFNQRNFTLVTKMYFNQTYPSVYEGIYKKANSADGSHSASVVWTCGYNDNIPILLVYNSTSTTIADTATISTKVWKSRAVSYTPGTIKFYRDGLLTKTSLPAAKIIAYSNENAFIGTHTTKNDMLMDYFVYFPRVLTASQVRYYAIGHTGSSVSFNSPTATRYPITSTSQNIVPPSTLTNVNIISDTSETKTVTVTAYFTETTQKVVETKNATTQRVEISHYTPSLKTSGLIAYELDPLYSGTPSLSTTNPNATIMRNDTGFTISTGYLPTGSTYNYTVSVPDDHDHGFHIGDLMEWVGTGWDFVSTAPEDWTNYIGDQIEVTVS